MSYLRYLLLFAYSGVQHIVLCSCFVCLYLVCCVPSVASFPELSMCIAPSVFSNASSVREQDKQCINTTAKCVRIKYNYPQNPC